MSYSTVEERGDYRRNYRKELREHGGRRVDLHIDGRLNNRLMVYLAEYGYETHPGSALRALLEELTSEVPE